MPQSIDGSITTYFGLTKREYFAGLAMQSFISTGKSNMEEIAIISVKMGDELLKQLDK